MSTTSPPRSPSPRRSPQSLVGSPMLASPGTPTRTRSPQFGRIPFLQPSSPIRPTMHSEPLLQDVEEDPPRLIIKNLVLTNYKSYAGRQEVGPFNENFTAVVGPNGSGKSNVIDSLLFVFGFRAKKMRQDKLSGLIHRSEAHPDLDFARVEVIFETKNVPDSQLVLAREVKRDSSNFYSLNGKRSSYAEVTQLLEERGIDLRHKRFLILQGEVESIALMPPKAENDGDDGLLEYLEDIIGTSGYKTRIKSLESESDDLRTDSGEKQRRVAIVAKDLQALENDRANIERYMLDCNAMNSKKSKLFQTQTHKLQNAVDLSRVELADYQNELTEITSKIQLKTNELNQLEQDSNQKLQEKSQLSKRSKQLSTELKKLHVDKTRAEQLQSQFNSKKQKAERDLEHAKFNLNSSISWLDNFNVDKDQIQSQLETSVKSEEVERQLLTEIESDLHEKTKDLHSELDNLQQQAAPWRDQILQKNQELNSIAAKSVEMDKRVEDAQAEEKQCVQQAEELIEQGKSTKKRIHKLTSQLESMDTTTQQLTNDISQFQTQHNTVQEEANSLTQEIRTAKAAKQQTQNRNRLESELMRLKIPGLYGRLGSLGSIDPKYDVAISTACRDLNNYVVDTVNTAKQCVNALRKHRLGRAKFMVLDKLEPNYTRDPNMLPAPRLLDLVKPMDSLFFKAFASVLGDTLVVPNADEATRVAFSGPKRYRVVTLGGIFVQIGGQMSGGGKPMSGLMSKVGASVSSEELSNMESKLSSLQYDIAELRSKINQANDELSKCEQESPKLRIELDKDQMLLSNLEKQMMAIREKRRQLKTNVQNLINEVETKTVEFESHKSILTDEKSQLESQSNTVEKAIQEIQQRILDIGGLRLREQRSKVRNFEIQIEELRKRIEEESSKKAQHESKIKKYESEIVNLNQILQETYQPEFSEESEKKIIEYENEVSLISANISTLTAEIENGKQETLTLKTELEEIKAREINTTSEIEKLDQIIKVNERRIMEIKKQQSNLTLYDVRIARNLTHVSNNNTNNGGSQDGNGEDSHDNDDVMETDVEGIYELSPDEIEALNESELRSDISKLEEVIRNAKVNMEILDLYRQRYAEYVERKSISDEATSKYETNLADLKNMKNRRLTEFMTGFLQVSAKLKEMYQLITMGGNAELELVDSMDPFAEGILFSVMPPKKSWRNIANLSGGEKTLSSLALVFALHHYKPTPLYVMDEIDAALDFRNVSIIANYIKERTKNGQFIVISLRNNMFELASRLVGVYKINNMTRSVAMQTE